MKEVMQQIKYYNKTLFVYNKNIPRVLEVTPKGLPIETKF